MISNDLKILGQGLKIISRGTLQVDGEVEGDVAGSEVIIGEQGKVTGTVAAERVIVRGKISGVIRGVTVALQSSARVEGDIHHMSLAIEQGAEFDGRCRRPQDASELKLDLDGITVERVDLQDADGEDSRLERAEVRQKPLEFATTERR